MFCNLVILLIAEINQPGVGDLMDFDMNTTTTTTTTAPLIEYNVTCDFWTMSSRNNTFYITFTESRKIDDCIYADLQSNLNEWIRYNFEDTDLTFDVEINSNVKSGMVLPNIYDFVNFTDSYYGSIYEISSAFGVGEYRFCESLGYTNHLNVLTVKDVVFSSIYIGGEAIYLDLGPDSLDPDGFYPNQCFRNTTLVLDNVRGGTVKSIAIFTSIINSSIDSGNFTVMNSTYLFDEDYDRLHIEGTIIIRDSFVIDTLNITFIGETLLKQLLIKVFLWVQLILIVLVAIIQQRKQLFLKRILKILFHYQVTQIWYLIMLI